MSASGSPSISSRSANAPSLTLPICPRPASPSSFMIGAPHAVADSIASIDDMPRYFMKYSRSFALVPCGVHANP